MPDAPPAPRPKGVKVELFETKVSACSMLQLAGLVAIATCRASSWPPCQLAPKLHCDPALGGLQRQQTSSHCTSCAAPQGMDQPAGGAGAAGDNPVAALLSTIDFSEPMSFDGEEKTE